MKGEIEVKLGGGGKSARLDRIKMSGREPAPGEKKKQEDSVGLQKKVRWPGKQEGRRGSWPSDHERVPKITTQNASQIGEGANCKRTVKKKHF